MDAPHPTDRENGQGRPTPTFGTAAPGSRPSSAAYPASPEAIGYTLKLWDGLSRFLHDGRIELDTNTVERAMRPIALNRKNALFAGSNGGAEHLAVIASLVETCKLNNVNPHTYLSDVLERLVAGHPQSRIDELIPWAYRVNADV